MMRPLYKTAVRTPSSSRLYHLLRRNSAPGKNAASTMPRKSRVQRAVMKLERGADETVKWSDSMSEHTFWPDLVKCEDTDSEVMCLTYIPVPIERVPHTTMQPEMYSDGLPMWFNDMLLQCVLSVAIDDMRKQHTYEGVCVIVYPAYSMDSNVGNCWSCKLRSCSNPRRRVAL